MSFDQFFKARTLVRRGEVRLLKRTASSSLYFSVKDYSVMYNGRKDNWSCTCEYSSLWSKQKKLCCHIRACKQWMRENVKGGEKVEHPEKRNAD